MSSTGRPTQDPTCCAGATRGSGTSSTTASLRPPCSTGKWPLGPRELDLGWFIFLHRFFQDIAEFFELPGLPGFLRRSAVEAHYERLAGHSPRYMEFYLVYAAVRPRS